MPVGETRSVERETQGWVSPVLQAEQDSEEQQARRATGRARRRSRHYVEHPDRAQRRRRGQIARRSRRVVRNAG